MSHIVEEIESLGRSEKRELRSRLAVLLLHLLKWQYQPCRRSRSWEIVNARLDLDEHLTDNPSLKATLPETMISAYHRARLEAEQETGRPSVTFPTDCPWTFDQAMLSDPGTSTQDNPVTLGEMLGDEP